MLDSVNGDPLSIDQCVNFPAVRSHALSAAVLGVPSQSAAVDLLLNCELSDQINCGSNTGSLGQTFNLSPSVTPEWHRWEHIMLLPAGTLSANCSVTLNSPGSLPFSFFVDALKVRDSEVIFADDIE